MIRSTGSKIKRYIAGDTSNNQANSKENKLLNRLVTKASVSRQINKKSDTQISKSDELLYYVNVVKNGMTVKTGEFEALTRIFTGQKMYVDTRDISVAPHLLMDGQWEMGITKVFQRIVKEGDTVLDIGANFGYFGVVAGAKVGNSGRVVLVEANKLLIPYINKSLSVNGLQSFSSVEHVAMGSTEGFLELNVLEGYMGSSSVVQGNYDNLAEFNTKVDHKEKVRSTSCDILCKELGIKKVDVIKIDIEGYEDVAYGGMRATIKKSPGLKIFLEFTGSSYKKPEDFFATIKKDFPFVYAISEDSGLTPVDTYSSLKKLSGDDWIMILLSKEAV